MTLPRNWRSVGDYFIPYRLLILARMIERDTTRLLQVECDLTAAEWQVLALACRDSSTSAADVSASFGTDAAQVSRTVLRMIKAGLVEREYGKNNRKQKKITVTDAGRSVFERAHAQRKEFFAWILQDLNQDDRDRLNKMMELIAIRVGERREEDA